MTSLNADTENRVKLFPGAYEIPFSIKDNIGHSWQYSLSADLEIPKPEKYELALNFPNPFNSCTTILYSLANAETQRTRLTVYDIAGRKVRVLKNHDQSAGYYKLIWDGKNDAGVDVPSGVYFYELSSGPFSKIQKMTLIK
ncbi:T9SS type A sorting domain-containing protein [candidate division KSB1 bacterium]|nr:T9SS type A sorting domain-containing protein [candidate division KSB1 bacterium]